MSDDDYEEDFDYGEEFEDENYDVTDKRSRGDAVAARRSNNDDNDGADSDDDDDDDDGGGGSNGEALSGEDDSAPTSPMNQASYERLDPTTRIIASNEDRLRYGTFATTTPNQPILPT
jgi:hypothetical protein